MTDLTSDFNELLKARNAPPVQKVALSLQHIDEFLKEAYRINSHIASLTHYLTSIRTSYLSTSPPPRRHQHLSTSSSKPGAYQHLTDRQRDEIDAETKQLLRELNYSIRNLADAEQLRQNTETTLLRKRFASRLGAVGKWAAGGTNLLSSKSQDQEDAEAKHNAISTHRENVLWYLRQKLQAAGALQAGMMETRITREMEKQRSVLSRAKGRILSAEEVAPPVPGFAYKGKRQVERELQESGFGGSGGSGAGEDELTPQQLQMFERENREMVRHYEETLNQVRTAEKSLLEISELQTQLVNNLATQSAHIDQLVADSHLTAENVGGGNKELKRASERKSTARMVFYASCAVSAVLVGWDFLI